MSLGEDSFVNEAAPRSVSWASALTSSCGFLSLSFFKELLQSPTYPCVHVHVCTRCAFEEGEDQPGINANIWAIPYGISSQKCRLHELATFWE